MEKNLLLTNFEEKEISKIVERKMFEKKNWILKSR
jgi:hypothetical protein